VCSSDLFHDAGGNPMDTWKRALPASAVAALAVMLIAFSITSQLGELTVLALGVMLFVRMIARRHAVELLGSQYPRHGDRMD